MAKLTLTDGTIFEGTTEEIFAITERFNGVKADEPLTKTVKRYAEVGELILVVNADMAEGKYKNGDILTVSEIDMYDREGSVQVSEHNRHLYSYEYEVIVDTEVNPKAEAVPTPLKVGDYAKVLVKENSYNGFHEVGAIIGITKVDSSELPYQAVGLDGKESRWFKVKHIVKATDEEVAEAKALVKKAAKEAVFTQAGRKPNEYRKGDIVRVFKADGKSFVGFVTIGGTLAGGDCFGITLEDSRTRGVFSDEGDTAEPIVFVESRLDRN